MPVLLFVDSLGTKQAWQTGGETAAKDAFNRFNRIVIGGALNAPAGSIMDAMIESDSAGFICESVSSALLVAGKMYRLAFHAPPRKPFLMQTWLRGAIVDVDASVPLRTERLISKRFGTVRFFSYSNSLLDAIWIEKSGFKGMRLLVQSALLTDAVRKEFRVAHQAKRFPMIRRLRRSAYPKQFDGVPSLTLRTSSG